LPKLRILQTGGVACGEISIKSKSTSAARVRASRIETIPRFSPFSSIKRTSFTFISSLMRGPSSSRTGAFGFSLTMVPSYKMLN